MSLLPTQGPPPILSAQKTFRHRGPPLGTAASSRRQRGLLSAVRGLLSAAQGPLLGIGTSLNPLSTEDRSYQHRGPPLCTGASSRHRGLLQSSQHRIHSGTEGLLSAAQGLPLGTGASSRRRKGLLPIQGPPPQHRGVGPFGIVSLLPTQGPPPILSAQKTFRHRGPPLGTGASSRRHRGLLSAVRGLLSAAQGPLLGIGASFNPLITEDRSYQHRGPPLCTGASSRHRGGSNPLSNSLSTE